MKLTSAEIGKMEAKCTAYRRDVVRVLYSKQTGHPGGSLSVCEILTVLFEKHLRVDPQNPTKKDRDLLVLSKGHAAPMLYRILAEEGYFPKEELNTLRDIDSRLAGHPCVLDTPGVDMTSGPLGMGLSAGLGAAIGMRLQGIDRRVYVVLGDGELNEGTNWEGCMAAAKYGADNLCAIVDWNRVQLDGTTDQIMPMGDLAEKFSAFGWHVLHADGHSVDSLNDALDAAKEVKGKPVVILADTVKGKGVSYMEGQSAWHGKPIDAAHYMTAMEELGGAE